MADSILPQVHFISLIVIACNFVPPVRNIQVQFISLVYSCWMTEHNCRIQSGQCTLKLVISFCLAFLLFFFVFFPSIIYSAYSKYQAIVFKSVCSETVHRKGRSVTLYYELIGIWLHVCLTMTSLPQITSLRSLGVLSLLLLLHLCISKYNEIEDCLQHYIEVAPPAPPPVLSGPCSDPTSSTEDLHRLAEKSTDINTQNN